MSAFTCACESVVPAVLGEMAFLVANIALIAK